MRSGRNGEEKKLSNSKDTLEMLDYSMEKINTAKYSSCVDWYSSIKAEIRWNRLR